MQEGDHRVVGVVVFAQMGQQRFGEVSVADDFDANIGRLVPGRIAHSKTIKIGQQGLLDDSFRDKELTKMDDS